MIVGDLVRPGDSGPDAIANVRWLTGFTGTSGLALVGPEARTMITDFRYTERAEKEVGDAFDRAIAESRLLPELASRLHGRVGFDDAATSVANLGKLERELGEGVELVAAGGLVEQLRRQKDAGELEAIAEAARLADEVYEAVLADGLAGRTEREVAFAAAAAIRERGAEPSFAAIVAAGPNGALPHAEPSEREIGAGELVVWDMGAQVDGYCSDCTRTFAAGEPEAEAREAYELVEAAQQAGLDAIRPGIDGEQADEAARAVIRDGGHEDHFGHGLGHGVGLEIHEAPRLGKRSEDVLAANEVVTIEPGVYVPGRFGIRIEDLVVVTDDGHRNLSSVPKAAAGRLSRARGRPVVRRRGATPAGRRGPTDAALDARPAVGSCGQQLRFVSRPGPPTHLSAPPPPLRRSPAAPPSSRSGPPPARKVSAPPPPRTVSRPDPVRRRSPPALPRTVSSPAEPQIKSLPSRPSTTSFPPSAAITSRFAVPVSWSSPSVPNTVATWPPQVGLGAAGSTVVVSVSVSLSGAGSVSALDTVAVLVSDPGLRGTRRISIVAESPLPSVPSAQLSLPPRRSQEPCEGVADTKRIWLGRSSATATSVAASGPALLTSTA